MTAGRSSLGLIFTTVTIDLIGFGIVIPVLPLYAEHFGASPTVVGLLMAVYSVMQFVFAPILGRLSDRVGRRPVLLVSIVGTSLGFLLMGLAHTLWLLFIARMIDGITGGNISTAQAYIADVTLPEERSRGMGWIGAAFGVGFVFGPAIGGVMSHFSLAAPFLCAAGLAAANAVALYFLLPESLPAEHRHPTRRASIIQVFEEAGNWQLTTVTVTYFVATVAFAILTATFALFTHLSVHFSYDATRNGYLFAYLGALGAMIQGGLLGRFVRTVGDKALAVAGTAVMAASLFVLPMSTTLGKLLVVITGIAIGNSLVTPTLNGIASRSVNAAWQGRVFGVMQSGASLARIIGPAVGGWLLDRDVHDHTTLFGKTPYWTGAVIMLVASCLALTIQTRRHE
ncbi:MAG: MFS transporter [Candidatus Latescibacteria bacterium]|nr:MFS transporter [Candidatus Latescibacterota bacterium]